jgi:hypothetical protein
MVSTRSRKTSYVINFPDEARPIRGNQHPISKYFAHLDVVEKLILLKHKSNSTVFSEE